MIFKKNYPFSFDFIEANPQKAKKIILKKRPHKGAFVGFAKLEGSFLCENKAEIFDELAIGERLSITPDPDSKLVIPPLEVYKQDILLGQLPTSCSVLPNLLLSRGLQIWCYAEAKRFDGFSLEIAVSVYCQNY